MASDEEAGRNNGEICTAREWEREAQQLLCTLESAVYQIEEIRTFGGLLNGDWEPRLHSCHACSVYTRHSRRSEDLDVDINCAFDPRLSYIFDLRFRRALGLPAWLSPELMLWGEAGVDPCEVTGMATVAIRGQLTGQYSRRYDDQSFIFVRPCENCGTADPFDIGSDFHEKGLSNLPGPHLFIQGLDREEGQDALGIERSELPTAEPREGKARDATEFVAAQVEALETLLDTARQQAIPGTMIGNVHRDAFHAVYESACRQGYPEQTAFRIAEKAVGYPAI